MQKLLIRAVSPFRSFSKQVLAVFSKTFIASAVLPFTGEEMLRVQPIAIFASLMFFLNIKSIFNTKDAWEEIPFKILIFMMSCGALVLFTQFVSSGNERVANLGLFVGIMFTVPVTVAIGMLRDFNFLKREE